MKNAQQITNTKKRRRNARRELNRLLTPEEEMILEYYLRSGEADEAADILARMRGDISVLEARIVLAIADLERARRAVCAPGLDR